MVLHRNKLNQLVFNSARIQRFSQKNSSFQLPYLPMP